ncbi:DUF1715-domain-containing protein [Cubamyces lactineus]|nr:DUF1715-domain-containing protein [Cubamyces lactineus]
MDFDLEELVNVEQAFYEDGYKDGFAHGRIHGSIEGRALGREKGFEMWEELGFYEGFAIMWKAIVESQAVQDERTLNHIRHLLELIAQFPRENPSAADGPADLDIPKLFRQIRSRYKLLCATLGVRPTLRAADGSSVSPEREGPDPAEPTARDGPKTQGARKNVWAVQSPSETLANTELNF